MRSIANTPKGTRILYLDDSGTPSPKRPGGETHAGFTWSNQIAVI